MHNRYSFGVADENVLQGERYRMSFSSKYYRAAAENSIKPLFFMYHEPTRIFLRSKNVLNLVYF